MVTRQVTQDSPESHDDSVRITAQVRRQVEIDLLTRELVHQQAVVDNESRDLKTLRRLGLPCAQAERRASNATAVLQYIGSTLRGLDENRDF